MNATRQFTATGMAIRTAAILFVFVSLAHRAARSSFHHRAIDCTREPLPK